MSENNLIPIDLEEDPDLTPEERVEKELARIEAEQTRIDKNYRDKVKNEIQVKSLEDYEFIRSSIYDAISSGQELLYSAVTIAKETEAPRAIEVAAALVKSLVDSSQELLKTQKNLLEINEKVDDLTFNAKEGIPKNARDRVKAESAQMNALGGPGAQPAGQVQITMTTKELLEMIKNAEEESQADQIIEINPAK